MQQSMGLKSSNNNNNNKLSANNKVALAYNKLNVK